MDPYLEDPALWPAFQRALLTTFAEVLIQDLKDRYHVVLGQLRYAAPEPHEETCLEVRQPGTDQARTGSSPNVP
jgi:hypothetical protein